MLQAIEDNRLAIIEVVRLCIFYMNMCDNIMQQEQWLLWFSNGIITYS